VSRRRSRPVVWRDALRESGLDATARHVAHVLSTYMDGRGRCWPSRETLAAAVGLSVRTVERAVQRLEAVGWLRVERTEGGRHRTNTYEALLPQTASQRRRLEWETASSTTGNGVIDDRNGVTGVAQKTSKKTSESGAPSDAAPLSGSASSARNNKYPEGECERCHETRALVDPDSHYCAECFAEHEPNLVEGAPSMSDAVRFPGAVVDYDFLDAFEWTPELLREYAARARTLAHRYGSNAPTAQLGRWPRGVCQDCRRVVPRRFCVGRLLVCERDAESRLRVRRSLAERLADRSVGSVGEGWRAYCDLWRVAWTYEELERRQREPSS
jgi:hypothetical protein